MPKGSEQNSKPKMTGKATKANEMINPFGAATEVTAEPTHYVAGLFAEFRQQVGKYGNLTMQLAKLEATVELNEKTLCVIRDHLTMVIDKTDSAMLPADWTEMLNSVRFVGWRLADACVELLKEHRTMTAKEIVAGLNSGMFRFRTNAPLREIHAALLRHPFIRKEDDQWVWCGTDEVNSNSPDKETAPQEAHPEEPPIQRAAKVG